MYGEHKSLCSAYELIVLYYERGFLNKGSLSLQLKGLIFRGSFLGSAYSKFYGS